MLLQGVIAATVHADKPKAQHDPQLEQDLKTNKKVITNYGTTLLYTKGKSRLLPGPNLGDTFRKYALSDAQYLALNPNIYKCPPNNAECEQELKARFDRILTQNNIKNCGYLHGQKIMLVTKGQAEIQPGQCKQKIDLETETRELNTFIRLTGVVFDQDGDLAGKEKIEELINITNANNVTLALIIQDKGPSQNAKEYLQNLPSHVHLGTTEENGAMPGLPIKAFVPRGDDITQATEIPKGFQYCIRGAWDTSPSPIPCKEIDLRFYNWQEDRYAQDLKEQYNAMKKNDYEIGISIPFSKLDTAKVKELLK